MTMTTHKPDATDKQVNFIAGLANERDWDSIEDGQALAVRLNETMAAGIDIEQASKIIAWLKSMPRKTAIAPTAFPTPSVEGIPDGYYALRGLEGHKNEISFYRLNTGKAGGRWEGVQFIDQLAGPERHSVRGAGRDKVYEAIVEQGARAAMELYGREIGSCGVCNRRLTDDESRRIGIGPVCREGM